MVNRLYVNPMRYLTRRPIRSSLRLSAISIITECLRAARLFERVSYSVWHRVSSPSALFHVIQKCVTSTLILVVR